jgi:hypothetical protein
MLLLPVLYSSPPRPAAALHQAGEAHPGQAAVKWKLLGR